ncbi:hypothetical protein COU12_01155 [Candidatus Jorgensenbacteria bacterium CG10_big_fil_rev_8_21_14_0_10_54_38]|uniref:Uncharacterized protein n=2 Tax=Candidatus Joergenseniibacteriota TaxID=1752739 RepID=A0A2M6WGB5_9BACT|nr:MAG: hypothetical protein COX26_02620 [Candidatus Jorgensenbacteria bacterium CG23_combo_of_CG06-09_8_20_14_all_54_14]PIT91807.1 MAG: hypothetical protein COU12_01155 [Candidatus Jorgensenbacteria bacterium CG10_big_fil_rev_8_21_14_0_10_54_38]
MKRTIYPKIKLAADAKRDAQLGVNFLKFTTHGKDKEKFLRMFFPDELINVINGKASARMRDKLIRAYALRVHKGNRKEIAEGVLRARKEWASAEKKFFRLADRIFNHRPWPNGNYRGFVTVFYAYPRDIQRKVFYFPYNHHLQRFANKTIAHEMLHFMFFDYVEERYGLKEHARIPGKPRNYLWQVSEAFNTAIQLWKPYRKVFQFGSHPHPGTEKLAARMIPHWAREQNIDKFLDRYLL